MKSILGAASAAALMASLCACATVTRGTSEQFKVVTAPPGASVRTSTGFTCSPTPCSIKLPRKTGFDTTVSLAGYKSQTVHVRSEVGGGGAAGFAGNMVAGGVLGMAVDSTDGAMDDLKPNPLKVTLEPQGPMSSADPAPAAVVQATPSTPAAAKP